MADIFKDLFKERRQRDYEELRMLEMKQREREMIEQQMLGSGMAGQFSSGAFMPGISSEEEEELEVLVKDRAQRTEETKIEIFKGKPSEIREAILDIYRQEEIENTLKSIANVKAEVSKRERDLEMKKNGGMILAGPFPYESFQLTPLSRVPDGSPSYKQLMKAHVDRCAEEMIEDKNE